MPDQPYNHPPQQPYQWQPQPGQQHYPQPYPQWQPPKKKRTGLKIAGLAVAGVAGFLVMLTIIGSLLPDSDDETDTAAAPTTSRPYTPPAYSRAAAEIACEHAIDARLVSPATSKYTYTVEKPSGAGFEMRGYVDSQNRFGASMRSVFGCKADASRVTVTELTGL